MCKCAARLLVLLLNNVTVDVLQSLDTHRWVVLKLFAWRMHVWRWVLQRKIKVSCFCRKVKSFLHQYQFHALRFLLLKIHVACDFLLLSKKCKFTYLQLLFYYFLLNPSISETFNFWLHREDKECKSGKCVNMFVKILGTQMNQYNFYL